MPLSSERLKDWQTGGFDVGAEVTLIDECLRLRGILRGLHGEAISAEDGAWFAESTAGTLTEEIRSWGDEAETAKEYMEAQLKADELARDRAEFERLREKLGK